MKRPDLAIWPYRPQTDYAVAAEFWRGHGVEPWPEHVMAPHGCVVMLDGDYGAIGHFYVTDANVAILAPMVSNPAMPERDQAIALRALVEALTEAAKAVVPTGFLLALAHQPAVKNLFVNRCGFRDTGSIGTACLVVAEKPFSLEIIEED